MALLTLLTAIAACTPERDQSELFAPEFLDILVIDAVLIVGQEFPLVKLSRTLAPNVPFNPDTAGETGATITIYSSPVGISFYDFADQPGVYQTSSGSIIQPDTEYNLVVHSTRGEVLTARTVTPALFSVDEWVLLDPSGSNELRTLKTFAEAGDDVYYQPENQLAYAEGLLEARFASGGAGQFGGLGYQLALFSIDPGSDYVIDPPFFEDEDFEDLPRKGSSPILNINDGRIRLPWFGIYFEGRHNYKVFVTDLNWYDLVRSAPQADGGLGFGGNAGDTQNRPIFHVDGGIGLFGSAAVDSVGFFVLPEN